MKQFKKRKLALVLASVVTVVGAFGAENYRNSLMSLKFESADNGAVNMTIFTKQDYEGNLNLARRDASTYIITLPGTNSEMTQKVDLPGGVQSYEISTMPYTTHNDGYTKITIKTNPNVILNAQKALYVAAQEAPAALEYSPETAVPPPPAENNIVEERPPQPIQRQEPSQPRQEYVRQEAIRSQSGVAQTGGVDIQESVRQFEPSEVNEEALNQDNTEALTTENVPPTTDSSASNMVLFLLGFVLVVCIIVYLIIRAKNAMRALVGDQGDFDLSDDEPQKKKKKEKKERITTIRKAVKTLDKTYGIPPQMPVNPAPESVSIIPEPSVEQEEEPNIVDLDELFQEKSRNNKEISENIEQTSVIEEDGTGDDNEENSALEDFLAAYSFDEDETSDTPTISEPETPSFDEDLYEKYITDENLKFSDDDVEKINKLLNSEIKDDTLKNISDYAKSEPKPVKRKTQQEILEDFVTTYSISQNIVFSDEDIKALNKLISVEIDNDFITNLKIDPGMLREKSREYSAENKEKPHKTSELLTLNVKDLLPDLSEALKKQGGRRIESEVKPTVVYYSEGYDVSILSLKDKLPDLSIEINNKDAYKSRPSDEIQYAESGYDVQKMSIAGELPDLHDALKHPEKYETKQEEPVVVDEEALLKNITNVQFKPFYDGSESFEVINEFDDSNAPSVSDVQKEFSQFGDLEIIRDDEFEVPASESVNNDYDDFVSLYDNSYLDFDKRAFLKDETKTPEELDNELEKLMQEEIQEQNKPNSKNDITEPAPQENTESVSDTETEKLKPEIFVPEKPKRAAVNNRKREDEAEALIRIIQDKQAEKTEKLSVEKPAAAKVENVSETPQKTCMLEGKKYSVVSETRFTDKVGCYLAQNDDGYSVIGFVGGRTFKIKHYDKLNTEKIQARQSEKLADGVVRYIIRIGIHKFILNVSDDNLEFIMDLC